MQKITLKEKVTEFTETLNSEKIAKGIRWLKQGRLQGRNHAEQQKQFNERLDTLIQDIINSKSNYDNAVQSNSEMKQISDSINSDLYKSESISKLISELSKITKYSLVQGVTSGKKGVQRSFSFNCFIRTGSRLI